MRCELSRAEVSAVVQHLLTNCRECTQVTACLWDLGEWPKALTILLQEAARQERSATRRRRARLETGGPEVRRRHGRR
jgi:hypothetical protein